MELIDLGFALLAILLGLHMLIRPKVRERVEQERLLRIAEIDAGLPESFFEEKRSLEAYPASRWVPRSRRNVQLLGIFLLLFGVYSIGSDWLSIAT
jgi:hypothetical protein